VTLQPLRRFDLDAAILFSDILVVPQAMGLHLNFLENEGPVLETVGSLESVQTLADGRQSFGFAQVTETVRRLRQALPADKALIGFCGAPWTVASYMIEGRSSERKKAVAAAAANPNWYQALVEKLVEVSAYYLNEQVRAGAQALQIFDSWAGDVPEAAFGRVVLRPIMQIIERVRREFPEVPIIVFARGVGGRHGEVARKTKANAVSVEQDVHLVDVLKSLPQGCAVQGNLAPDVLLRDSAVVRSTATELVRSVPMQRHIFNLGHGILQQTPIENVTALIEAVRAADQEQL
jgi:uroporphyrinogen decarboxylase